MDDTGPLGCVGSTTITVAIHASSCLKTSASGVSKKAFYVVWACVFSLCLHLLLSKQPSVPLCFHLSVVCFHLRVVTSLQRDMGRLAPVLFKIHLVFVFWADQIVAFVLQMKFCPIHMLSVRIIQAKNIKSRDLCELWFDCAFSHLQSLHSEQYS